MSLYTRCKEHDLLQCWICKKENDEVSESSSNALLSVDVSEQGGNTTMISIGYMDDGLRKTLTISDTSRSSKFRMDKLKELLNR